jgi:hypothetical protein
VWALLIGGGFSGRAQPLEAVFLRLGNGSICARLLGQQRGWMLGSHGDAGESEGELAKRSCFEALSGLRS